MITITASGRLGRDSEVKRIGDGTVCNFAVAAESGRDKDTTWFDCELWGRRGEVLAQYLLKGAQVTVVGEYSTREHNGKSYAKIRVHDIALQGGGSGRTASASQGAQQSQGGGFTDDAIPF